MPALTWEFGSAYDLIISLHVLHNAAAFGLRPAWAAGVRQRLAAPQRESLERTFSFCGSMLEWIAHIPAPRNSISALHALAGIEPARRLESVIIPAAASPAVRTTLLQIAARGSANAEQRDLLRTQYLRGGKSLRPAGLEALIQASANPEATGEQFLQALQGYQQVFFAEEEPRLLPSLAAGLEHAQALASGLPVDALVETLSHGIRLEDLAAMRRLTLVPSAWVSPLVFHVRMSPTHTLIAFGVPAGRTSAGAEAVSPLVAALKALADPTRLQILRLLQTQPLQPAELARRLRLRPPTITHHLHALRLAGLVRITIAGSERRYAARLEALAELNSSLQEYLTLSEDYEQHR